MSQLFSFYIAESILSPLEKEKCGDLSGLFRRLHQIRRTLFTVCVYYSTRFCQWGVA
jgi:hypothetical protein